MSGFRAACRLLAGIWHVLTGLWIMLTILPRLSEPERQARVVQWSGQFLRRLGIQFQVEGPVPTQGPLLLVANHISWVDIPVVHAACFCRFISKSDVRHWPLIGMMADRVGTLFIERQSKRDAMRVVHDMAHSLAQGDVLTVFPEGTTSDGRGVLPFHANLLQAAISANAPVQPLALCFVDSRTGLFSDSACYVGDDALVTAIWRTLKAPGITVILKFGEPQYAQGRSRRAWASDLHACVLRATQSGQQRP